jgi:outer membrane protein TolC
MCCRPVYLWGCFVALFLIVPAVSMAQEILTLTQAIEEAQVKNPDLDAERQRLKIAQANRIQAGLLLPSNPEIEYERASDRFFDNRGSKSYGIALSQEIEIAGQRGKRKRIANLMIAQTQAEIVRFEQMVIAQVKTAYHRLAIQNAQLQVMQLID